MIILHSYCPTIRKNDQELPAILVNALKYYGYAVVDLPCPADSPRRYEEYLRAYWNTDDIIIVEQDIKVYGEEIKSLISCKKDWCAYQYKHRSDGAAMVTHGLGLTKISRAAQRVATPGKWLEGTYETLDARVLGWLSVNGWHPHIHGTVQHEHKTDE